MLNEVVTGRVALVVTGRVALGVTGKHTYDIYIYHDVILSPNSHGPPPWKGFPWKPPMGIVRKSGFFLILTF